MANKSCSTFCLLIHSIAYLVLLIGAFYIVLIGPFNDILQDETIFVESFMKTSGMLIIKDMNFRDMFMK